MKILFQGDSITDAGRCRDKSNKNMELGCGYAQLIASRLMCDNDSISVVNGIHVSSAGNELMARKWIECVRNSGINI